MSVSRFPTPASGDDSADAIELAASDWLARRDRGLSAAEQDDYMQWLAADPRHGAALTRHARTLERMMQLHEWTPAGGMEEPNPDLFAPPFRPRRWWGRFSETPRRAWSGGLGLAAIAAAAAVMIVAMTTGGVAPGDGAISGPSNPLAAAEVQARAPSFLQVNERMALPDGSRIELNTGAEVTVLYSATERRVRLSGGEAHFTVWKDPARPFVVETPGVEVVAVGTAFNVRLGQSRLEVLVTEGRVKVQNGPGLEAAPALVESAGVNASVLDLLVSRGERAVVARAGAAGVAATSIVSTVSTEEISAELSWQAPRLHFDETRLADAVAEFNRLNRHQLELLDPRLGELRIGGNFRPDNVDAFVRLLGLTLDIEATEREGGRTMLSRRR